MWYTRSNTIMGWEKMDIKKIILLLLFLVAIVGIMVPVNASVDLSKSKVNSVESKEKLIIEKKYKKVDRVNKKTIVGKWKTVSNSKSKAAVVTFKKDGTFYCERGVALFSEDISLRAFTKMKGRYSFASDGKAMLSHEVEAQSALFLDDESLIAEWIYITPWLDNTELYSSNYFTKGKKCFRFNYMDIYKV